MERISKEQFIEKYGQGAYSQFGKPTEKKSKDYFSNKITSAIGLKGATDVFGSHLARQGFGPQTREQGQELIEKPSALQTAGAIGQTATIPAGIALTGGTSLVGQMAAGAALGYAYDVTSDLAEGKTGAGVLAPGGATVAGIAAPPVLRVAGTLLRPLTQGVARTVGQPARTAATEAVTEQADSLITPLQRTAREYAINRPSRLLERAGEAIQEQKDIARIYETATPQVKQVIDSNLDMRIVNAVTEADDATKAGYRQILDIAEQGKTKLGATERPEIVAGNAAAEQYKLINTKRKEVGSEIGSVVDELSKTDKYNAQPLYQEIDSLLKTNGIVPEYTQKGVKLNFAGSNLTDKQRTAIQKLYEIMTETGDTLTPRQIYNKDNLLSQLQREARFDGVSDIYIKNTEGQDINLFSGLRQIFSEELEGVAPQIKELNKEYRQLRGLQDDIENSIFKSGNFEGTKGVDPAEFAQTNLRRLFSDAQSAADYRAIYNNLDAYSRALGYEGARADDLAAFAVEMRKLYPESVPPTSATGIFGGVVDTAKQLIGAGKANTVDQQKALRALLQEGEAGPVSLQAAQGGIAGVQIDENGDFTFNPVTGALGVAGMAAASKGGGKKINIKTVAKNMDKKDRGLIVKYLDSEDSMKTFMDVHPFLKSTNVPDNASFAEIREYLKAVLNAYNG